MVLHFEHLRQLWGEPLAGPGADGLTLAAVRTDSRAELEGCLFVPLVGERFDAHRFLPQVLERAAAAIAQRDCVDAAALLPLAQRHGCALWLVDDSLQAYQELARLWRRSLALPVVAVTGSAGKTTTRELIRAALAPLGPVVASSGNENNDIGAPLTVLKADAATAALVVEMGMRGLGEIARLSVCAEPDVAVITNIGTAHIGRLGSREAIATAKCEITTALRPDGLVVIPAGDPLLDEALARVWGGRVLRVAVEGDPAAPGSSAADLSAALDDSSLVLPSGLRLPLPLAGRHNARNLLLAVAVAQELGVEAAALCDLAVQVQEQGGRNRRLQLGGLTVLDETYNASPEAVLAALELLAAQNGRRFAVLGTMLELGDQSLELHRRVAARAAELDLDGLVIVDSGVEGAAMAEAAASLPLLVQVATPEQAAEPLSRWLTSGDVLLLKASRGVALERLIPLLPKELTAGQS